MNTQIILYIVAFVFFLLAAAPMDKRGWSFEWIAFAALVLSLMV